MNACLQRRVRQPLEMRMVDHRRHELAIVRFGRQRRRRLFEAGVDVDEAGRRASRSAVTSASANSQGPGQSAKYRANGAACITCSASSCARARFGPPPHCACSRPPGSQRAEDAGEERRVILDPVERRGAEHEIGPVGERQVGQRDLRERDARAEARAAGWRAPSSACSTIDRWRRGGRAAAAPSARRSAGRCRSRRRWRARRRRRVRRFRTFCPQLVCGPDTL